MWALTVGTVRDVEVDEVFVVLEGDATVRFETGESVDLAPGVVVRLRAGERTEWEVRSPAAETLRGGRLRRRARPTALPVCRTKPRAGSRPG